jgi:hypothetical protein
LIEINHDVGVDISIAGMSEAGDGQVVLFLELRGEAKEVLKSPAGNDDVLIQLCETRIAQGVREFAPDLPDSFSLAIAQPAVDKEWVVVADDAFEVTDFGLDRFFLAVELDD